MRTLKVLAIVALIISLSGNVAFAAPDINATKGQEQTDNVKKDKKELREKRGEFDEQQDPVKVLEKKKERVQSLLREGKIEKEKADEITAKIDARIKKIQEFNSLTLQQKKETLINDYKIFVEKKVKDERMTQEKAAELLKAFTEKVEQWDGSGYPGFLKHGSCGKCKHKESDTGK